MKRICFLAGMALIIAITGCQNQSAKVASGPNPDSLLILAKNVFQPLPAVADNPENQVTPEKVALGKMLYSDNRLSKNNTESCNTCHNLATYGVDNKATSPGDNGKNGNRNSPTTFNAALHFVQFWDGRMKSVEEQAGGPVMNPAEMNMPTEKEVISRLGKDKEYKQLFAAAYPGEKDPISFENMRKAIAAFERTLITPSKFDKFLGGDVKALDSAELAGLKTFMDAGCTACHAGALLGGNMFQKYPLFGDHKTYTGATTDDKGKMEATKNEADKYFFKVPSLRNIAETWPYLHDGSVKELDKTAGIMAKAQLNKDLAPDQIASITVFLKSLTGEVPGGIQMPPATK